MAKERSDDEIIAACAAGCSDPAWREFIRRFGRLIYGAIYGVLNRYGFSRRHDLADDVYQQVLLEFWEKKRLAALRDRERLRPFLIAAAVSRTVDAIRLTTRVSDRNNKAASFADAGPARSISDGPRRAAEKNETQKIVEEELSQLTAKEGLVMRLTFQEEFTHRETADLLGLPVDTVSTLVRRTRDKIKTSLVQKGFEDL